MFWFNVRVRVNIFVKLFILDNIEDVNLLVTRLVNSVLFIYNNLNIKCLNTYMVLKNHET